jgi:prepilin-type N-terminal cleavage/methylation domain-containing protein
MKPRAKEFMRHRSITVSGKRTPEFSGIPGFSMLEMLLVLIVIGILVTIGVTKTSKVMRHERVNRAAQVMVQDFQNGFAMAGRQRALVRLTFSPTAKTYTFTDRAAGTVYLTRYMDNTSEFQLSSMTPSSNTIDVLPNGIGSSAFTVTIALGDYSKTVSASTAGFVRAN